jgi:hypothetical protein
MPEALPLERPVMAFRFGIGEAAPLKPQSGDQTLTRAQLVLALAGRRLHPEKFLSARFGNGPHAASLSNPAPLLFPSSARGGAHGGGNASTPIA